MAGGNVTGGGSVSAGSNVTVAATPNEGYTFTIWTEGGTQISTNTSYSFTANADRTLVANFSINAYTLTYTDGANGSITGASSQTVNTAQAAPQSRPSRRTAIVSKTGATAQPTIRAPTQM